LTEKERFHLLLNLYSKQPWLADKSVELDNLVYKDCTQQQERDLVFDLLSRVKLVTIEDCGILLRAMAEEIVTNPHLTEDTTLVAAMTADSQPDSGQVVIYDLRTILADFGWYQHEFTNRYDHIQKTYKRSPVHSNIVLVDEFVGSGQTVKGRVKAVKETFDRLEVTDYSIYVEVLVSTEMGAKAIADSGIKFNSQVTIKKGITDHYSSQEEIERQILNMKNIEAVLQDEFRDFSMPSLGFGNTEALYYREKGNCPNNVFPILWWPVYKNDARRATLLTRAF
jgi:hypothetical protein